MTTYYCFSWHGHLAAWDRDVPRDVQLQTLADPHGKIIIDAERYGWYSPATGVFLALPRAPGDVITPRTTMRLITVYRVRKAQKKRMAKRFR